MIGDELLDLACLTYSERDVAERYQRAQRRLEQDPSQSSASIFTAAAVGDAQAAETLLREDPTLVSTRGGPHAMEPLLYLCYARLHSPDPAHNPLEVAKLLLASGADPNAYFSHPYGSIFTALTGALGEENAARTTSHPTGRARSLRDCCWTKGLTPTTGKRSITACFATRRATAALSFCSRTGSGQATGSTGLQTTRAMSVCSISC